MNFSTIEYIEKEDLSFLNGKIIGAAIEIHRALRPDFLESVYEACLLCKLRLRK